MRAPFLLPFVPLFLLAFTASAQITGGPAAEEITRLTLPRDASIVANSVDAGTGAFSMEATVLSVNGARPLDFPLLFDSIDPPAFIVARPRSLGPGWTHPYSASIAGNPDTFVTVWWDDNRRNTFEFLGGEYVARDETAQYDRLTRQGDEWRLTRPDGTEYRFNEDGRLYRLSNKIRQRIEIDHDLVGRISKIVEPASDKEITFHYASPTSPRLSYLVDPAGRETHFLYTELGQLSALHNPTEFDEPLLVPAVSQPIPDNDPDGLIVGLQINRDAPMGLLRLTSMSIGHGRPDDLTITLTSPEGTSVEIQDLARRAELGGLIASGLVLDAFEGEDPDGLWQLKIVDDRNGEVGMLDSFNLTVSNRTFPTYLRYQAVRLVEALDARGERLFLNGYDSIGRVVSQDDGRDDTPPATFTYRVLPSGGERTTYTDRLGNTQIFEHDENYHLVRYVNPLGAETTYEYNGKGERAMIEDPLGRVTTFDYDDDGNLTRVVDPALNVSRMEYDSQRNMTRFIDAAGEETTFQYNNGNVTRIRDALGHQTRKTYGGNGQLIENMLHDNAGVAYTYSGGMVVGARRMDASGSKTERTDYDALGYPTSLTDAEGRETELEYDERLNVVLRIDPMGHREEKEYDERNRLVRLTDARGEETTFAYDGNNNLVMRTNALGETTTFLYDHEDRQVEVIDPLGKSVKKEFDAAGRLVKLIDGTGRTTTHNVYDEVGNLIEVYDAEDRRVRKIEYDERDLAVSVTDALGATVLSAYDETGNLIRITDPAGEVTRLRYDELGRLLEVEDPLGRVVKKEYFSDDVVQAIEDASGARTTFRYDNANRITQITPHAGSVAATEYRYDEAYQKTRDDLPGGGRRNYEYDDAGRITKVSYTGDNAPGDRNYSYDANGNLLEIDVDSGGVDPSGVQLERTYDELNRVEEFTDAHGTTLRYDYDASGNLSRLTYPDGRRVGYVYDELNQLVEIVDWSNRRTEFEYDSDSRITRIVFPNDVERRMDYDAGGRLTRRRDIGADGTVLLDYEYEYDLRGRVTVESGGLPAAPYMPEPSAMTYRTDGRLQTINGVEVEYDARHNITGVPLGDQMATLEYNLNDRLIEVNGFEREYDAADQLIALDGPDGRRRLSVNPQSALTQVLIQREGDGTIHRYVYGGGLLYEETGGDIRVYHYDYRGNTVAFTNGAGAVTGTVSYGPYGEIASRSGDSDSLFLHGGLWGIITDPDTELQYMRFRWYAPQLKRFLSKDAHIGDISNPASLNRYGYAGANPVSFNDPSGEVLNLIAGAVGAGVGAVVGVTVTVVSKAVTGQKITAGDIIGSAIGGAITGGLTGLCLGVCGPAAVIAGGVVAGAIGGAAGNASQQGIDILTGADEDGQFDLQAFGVEVAAGAVFGAIPFAGKGGKAAGKALGGGLGRGASAGSARGLVKGSVSKVVRKVPGPGGSISVAIPKKDLGGRTIFPALAGRSAVQDAAAQASRRAAVGGEVLSFLADVGVGLAQNGFVALVSSNSGSPPASTPPGSGAVQDASVNEVNAGQRGVYGEFAHWNLYQSLLAVTGVLPPNNPNSPLAEF